MSLRAGNIFSAITSIALMIVADILCLYFCKNTCCSKNDHSTTSMVKSNKKITIISSIVFITFIIAINIGALGSISYLSIANSATIYYINYLAAIFYYVGMMAIVLVFILRIIYTFSADSKLSIFAYSTKTIIILYATFILNIIQIPIIFIMVISNSLNAAFILSGILVIHYVVNYIACFVLFIKKIIVMIRYRIDNRSEAANNNINSQEMNTMTTTSEQATATKQSRIANKTDVIFEIGSIDLLIRYSLLVLTGFTSTVLSLVVGIIIFRIYDDGYNDFENLIFRIDSFINALCLYLLFGFGKTLYYKICKSCDRCLKNCFLNSVIKGNNDELTEEDAKHLLFETI